MRSEEREWHYKRAKSARRQSERTQPDRRESTAAGQNTIREQCRIQLGGREDTVKGQGRIQRGGRVGYSWRAR